MAKQIKIGYDKTPAPVTKQFIQLIDSEGTPLFDDAGNPLVTEESAALTSLTRSDNALSIFANNNPEANQGDAIPVEEQFKETSQVSSSLLGVPRAETQLSLFSDVATYGLDTENWDASDLFHSNINDPYQWYQKSHPIYGPRSMVKFYEGSDEQALYLRAFPSQYTYPRGTKESRRSTPSTQFLKYMNFIALGRYLYNLFVGIDEIFAKENFLHELDASIVGFDNQTIINNFNFSRTDQNLIFDDTSKFYDVKYGRQDLQDSFDAIERWTAFYDKIIDRIDQYPLMPQSLIDSQGGDPTGEIALRGYKAFGEYNLIRAFCGSEDTRPGGGSNTTHYGILQSKRSFRYQPGRSSGFTFGARMIAGDETAQDQLAEWGCSNDTDEYMFQVKGSNFSIVRRSTIRMPTDLLERQGLNNSDQKPNRVTQHGLGNTNRLWETVIRREAFNGDKLLGDGDSGYILSFEEVTMYKIEFSWYGAIGAKFYAYVPIGNGECRWVRLHTFIIENGLGEPVLENADFKFKYLIYTNDTRDIKKPMYLYKYGSSCYIDGGDEGTLKLNSQSTISKSFDNRTPVLGIMPKETISNTKGESKLNYKKSYPSVISVTSDTNCRIDFEEINGSPNGVHFNYSPGIFMNGRHPKTRRLVCRYANSGQNALDSINPVQPSVSNTIRVGGQPKFPLVNDTFTVNMTDDSPDVNISADSVLKTFDTLQIGDCLTFGNNLTRYKIKRFTNQRPLQNVSVTSESGQFSCDEREMKVGEQFNVTGTDTDGAITGYSSGTVYRVSSVSINNNVTTFTLVNINETQLTTVTGGTTDLIFTTQEKAEYTGKNKTSLILAENYEHDADTNGDSSDGLTAKLQYQFNVDETTGYGSTDLYAHVIADGVYGCYVGPESKIYKRVLDYSLEEEFAEDARRLDGSIFEVGDSASNQNKFFEAQIVNYNTIVSSDTPITTNRFKIHFLNPSSRENNRRQFSEFLISVTPNKPVATADRDDNDPELKFVDADGAYSEFSTDIYPSIEYCHSDTDFDERDRVGLYERDPSYGDRLQVDPRLERTTENALQGPDGGMQSAIVCEVNVINYPFTEIIEDVDDEGVARTKIVFVTGQGYPSPGEIVPDFSEVGVDFLGTGFKYVSSVTVPDENDQTESHPYIYAELGLYNYLNTNANDILNGTNGAVKLIQTKTVALKDDWRANSLDESGAPRFADKKFDIIRAVNFDTQPLYPVFALGDNSRINGVVIEEISEQGIVSTHTPTLITEDTDWNTSISLPAQPLTRPDYSPTAFNAENDLSATRYDKSVLNPLRPGRVIYSYYVAENDTVKIDLGNIFARDRRDISRGALNNKAMFITASKLDETDADGNIQLSLTSKEQ